MVVGGFFLLCLNAQVWQAPPHVSASTSRHSGSQDMFEEAGQIIVNILSNDLVARNLPWLIILGFIVYFFFAWRSEVRETCSKEAEERRSDQILSMQRIRLTETNLATDHQFAARCQYGITDGVVQSHASEHR
jgi:hypothetical protein